MKSPVLALLVLASCGYRFTAPNSALPGGVHSVRVELLQNRTAEPNVEALLTQALREQLHRSGLLGGDAAEATLSGAVVAVSHGPLLASPGRLPTYRLTLTLQLSLMKGGQGVAQVSLSETEDYPSGPDALLSEANRGAALHRLAEVVARSATERLATGW